MPGSTLNLGVRGASCVVSWPTRLVLCAPDRRAIFIPSTDCPRHNSVFLACRKSDHLQQLTDCPKDNLVFLACRKHVTLVYRIWIVVHAHVVSSSISASHSRRILCVYLPPGGFAMVFAKSLRRKGLCGLISVPREIKAPTLVCMTEATQRYPLVLQATWLRAPAPRISGPVDPWTVGPSRGPFRGPLCFDRFSPVDRIF